MTGACGTDSTDGVSHGGEGTVMTPSMEKCLGLAAAPMFAIMALVTSVLGGGPMDLLCSGGQGGALSGMAPMYLADERLARGAVAEAGVRAAKCCLAIPPHWPRRPFGGLLGRVAGWIVAYGITGGAGVSEDAERRRMVDREGSDYQLRLSELSDLSDLGRPHLPRRCVNVPAKSRKATNSRSPPNEQRY